jgi:hypothetical protein
LALNPLTSAGEVIFLEVADEDLSAEAMRRQMSYSKSGSKEAIKLFLSVFLNEFRLLIIKM